MRTRALFLGSGKPLFSSHMLDLSEEPIEENLADCERILKRLAKIDMSLEIELGVTGGEEDGVGSDVDVMDNSKLYTQPEEVLQAYERLSSIGHFSVAAAFGNVHGVYKPGNVQLRPEILLASQKHVQGVYDTKEKPLDFVFHGGSGSSAEEIAEAVSYGVFKMNVDTDTPSPSRSAPMLKRIRKRSNTRSIQLTARLSRSSTIRAHGCGNAKNPWRNAFNKHAGNSAQPAIPSPNPKN